MTEEDEEALRAFMSASGAGGRTLADVIMEKLRSARAAGADELEPPAPSGAPAPPRKPAPPLGHAPRLIPAQRSGSPPPSCLARRCPALSSVWHVELGSHPVTPSLCVLTAHNDPRLLCAGLDPKVVEVYRQVGELMARYKSGRVPKAFKVIPALTNWCGTANTQREPPPLALALS